MSISIQTESYEEQQKNVWPKFGRHILASFGEDSIVVYQAFSPEIAEYAVKNGRFGGPSYNFTRMTWVKTNFLWMMYRAGWATKRNQERILALHLTREGFEQILRSAKDGKAVPGSSDHGEGPDEVRLQWDPDHDPHGGKMERRAIQLGLRGNVLSRFHDEWLLRIEDVTDFVTEQYQFVKDNRLDRLVTPRERLFLPSDESISYHIRLHGFDKMESDEDCLDGSVKPVNQDSESLAVSSHGACCSELLGESRFSKRRNKKGSESYRVSEQGSSCTDMKSQVSKLSVDTDSHTDDVSESSNDVIICLGGAFNPVHTRHVQVMQETKTWIEEEKGFKVVAGVLAAAPDGYVKAKCKKTKERGIKANHRIRMCEIACRSYDWLKPYRKSTGSAYQGGELVKKEEGLRNARIVVIIGADRAVNKAGKAKWHSEKGLITVCAGRVGETAEMKQAYDDDTKHGLVHNPNFFILPKELDNVSSTVVRGKLQFDKDDDVEKKQTVVKEMVDLGWIDAKVGDYIVQNEQDLYFN